MKKKKQDGRKRSGRKSGFALLKNVEEVKCPLERFDYTRYGVHPSQEPEKSAFELAWVAFEYLRPGFITETKNQDLFALGNTLRADLERSLKNAITSGDGSFFIAFGKVIQHFGKIGSLPVHKTQSILQEYIYEVGRENGSMDGFREFWARFHRERNISRTPFPDPKTVRKACLQFNLKFKPGQSGRPKKN